MLVVASALSTPLAAQAARSPSWMFGLAATVGSSWQIEGADLGLVRPVAAGPVRYASIAGRLGTFQDEGAFVFGSRGFVAGLVLGAHTGAATIFEVGTEQNPIKVALDLTVETTGYLASSSPFPQGGAWLGVSILPGIRTIQTDAFGVSFVLGPTVFIGKETDVRTFLGFRIEIPTGPARAP
jgi:hypothetical protein